MQLAHDPANLAKRLIKINLGVARRVAQRHEHLPRPPLPLTHIVRDDSDAADEAMFITQTLIYPLRRMPLLLEPRLILFQYLVDERNERVKLWTGWWPIPALPRWHRMLQNF